MVRSVSGLTRYKKHQKGKDRWEIARDSNTKVNGDLQVGAKVTITYTMTATDVEVKAGKAAKTSPAKKP